MPEERLKSGTKTKILAQGHRDRAQASGHLSPRSAPQSFLLFPTCKRWEEVDCAGGIPTWRADMVLPNRCLAQTTSTSPKSHFCRHASIAGPDGNLANLPRLKRLSDHYCHVSRLTARTFLSIAEASSWLLANGVSRPRGDELARPIPTRAEGQESSPGTAQRPRDVPVAPETSK